MDALFTDFREAYARGSGADLSKTLIPSAPATDPDRLKAFYHGTDERNVGQDIRSRISYPAYTGYRIAKQEGKAWTEVYVAFWRFVGALLSCENAGVAGSSREADWAKTYTAWRDVANALIKSYSGGHFQAWTIPCLYVAGRYLRIFAMRADEQSKKANGDVNFSAGYQDDVMDEPNKNEKLEDAARVINRIFTLCISDRAPLEESRKWGLYYTTNLLFKTYFRLSSIGLSKNILRALNASQTDMPALESFPKSHTVTFLYYVGVIHFLEEDYSKAEDYLTQAWNNCYKHARKNLELILTYLIPCHLLTTHTLPSAALLEPYPQLQALFGPVCSCIKRGDLAGFDAALTAGEDAFVRRRIYLTLERGRDIALRNLFRKVFVAGGFEEPKEEGGERTRRTRIPVAEFAAAVRLGSSQDGGSKAIEDDEVECLLANLIYKYFVPCLNLMKGYISRERRMVVLSKAGTAFPGTGV